MLLTKLLSWFIPLASSWATVLLSEQALSYVLNPVLRGVIIGIVTLFMRDGLKHVYGIHTTVIYKMVLLEKEDMESMGDSDDV